MFGRFSIVNIAFQKTKVNLASQLASRHSVSVRFAPSIAICLIRVQLVTKEDVSGLIVMMTHCAQSMI